LGLEVVGDDLVHHLDAHLRDVFIVFAAKLSIFFQLFSVLPVKLIKSGQRSIVLLSSELILMQPPPPRLNQSDVLDHISRPAFPPPF
jgi:hypothetical protein